MLRTAYCFVKQAVVCLPAWSERSARRFDDLKSCILSLMSLPTWILRLATSETLPALMLVVAVGAYAGLLAQAKLTQVTAASVFNHSVEIPSEQPHRFMEMKSNEAFVVRTETMGAAMQLPHVLRESTSGGNERLIVRYWIYQVDEGSDAGATEVLLADNLVAVCEVVRTGNTSDYDVRVRLGIEHEDEVWRWIDIGSGDVDSRLLDVASDQFSPIRLVRDHLSKRTGLFRRTFANCLPRDYLVTSRPTNVSAIEICFDRLNEKLPMINENLEEMIGKNEDAFRDIMNDVASRIDSIDAALQSTSSLFAVSAIGGTCQSIAFGATGVVLLFLSLQLASVIATRSGDIGGDFVDECQGTIRLSGLIGTLIFLGAALSCVSVSPDPVKNAVSTAQMTSLAGQAFWTTLVSSICVRLVEATNYVAQRLSNK